MKLAFGLLGALLMASYLSSITLKLRDPALVSVAIIGMVMMAVDLWQARKEGDH